MNTQMVLEIVNFSDACTIAGDDPAAMAAATLLLGQGMYGLSGELEMPPFILGGGPEWFADRFGQEIGEYVSANEDAIAAVLDTFMYGHEGARQELSEEILLMPEDAREAYKRRWMDRRRSSMNNIGRHAAAIAQGLRIKAARKDGDCCVSRVGPNVRRRPLMLRCASASWTRALPRAILSGSQSGR